MVELTVEQDRLVVEPNPGPRYSLAELLEEAKDSPLADAEERSWVDGPAIGEELL